MKLTAMLMMAAAVAGAATPTTGSETGTVTVCLDAGDGSTAAAVARTLASRMFRDIGVTLQWHAGTKHCPAGGIAVALDDHTPDSLKPGAFAYALPYEGTHIRIFWDRIESASRPMSAQFTSVLLAHVLVHEITHILEGVSRHSATGVMKATWEAEDFNVMRWKGLSMAPEDVALIHSGMKIRAAAAAPSASTVALQ